ncbi:late competence development ComFB family protein [Tindallia californiensis]|uniref:Competence protein ComFB n=1 Tax=Tindallia californiensis TaxID=159292 RepID=A0A1H3MPY6_9FIRM|nr:late competence development ComFB family protein [Tindallia californiensis]SDY78721.1 competence protein ComFB [Tindallia californiensis]
MLQNYTETLVREVLGEYKSKESVCECEKCENDIVAMVLNNMPPKYFLSDASEGEKISYVLNKKLRFDALIQLTEAVKLACDKNHS